MTSCRRLRAFSSPRTPFLDDFRFADSKQKLTRKRQTKINVSALALDPQEGIFVTPVWPSCDTPLWTFPA